jgi:hypothetical protein
MHEVRPDFSFWVCRVFLTVFITAIFFISWSCCTVKKTVLSCPELPNAYIINKVPKIKNKHKIKLTLLSQNRRNRYSYHQPVDLVRKADKKDILFLRTSANVSRSINCQYNETVGGLSKENYACNLIASRDNAIIQNRSTPVILSNPSDDHKEIRKHALVSESNGYLKKSLNSVSYFSKELYSDRKKNSLIINQENYPQQGSKPKSRDIGTISLIMTLVGLFGIPRLHIAALVLLIAGPVLAAINLHRIKKHPDHFTGRGTAIASLVIAYLLLLLLIIVIVIEGS